MSKNQKQGNQNPKPETTTEQTEATQNNQAPKVELTGLETESGANTGSETITPSGDKGEGEGDATATPEVQPEETGAIDVAALTETGKAMFKYAKAMSATSPVTEAIVQNNQAILRNVVTTTLENYQGEEFTKRWAELLNIISAEPSAFSDRLIFRGFPMMKISKKKITALENVLILMASTANPAERKLALKTIDLDSLTKEFSDKAKQNLIGFYRNA